MLWRSTTRKKKELLDKYSNHQNEYSELFLKLLSTGSVESAEENAKLFVSPTSQGVKTTDEERVKLEKGVSLGVWQSRAR